VSLAPGRCFRSRYAGALLFLPLLAKIRFDSLVARAGYPGSGMIPAASALLSLLVLKLLDWTRSVAATSTTSTSTRRWGCSPG
jgi:hypothetical protein